MNTPTPQKNNYFQSLYKALEQQHKQIIGMLDILNEEHHALSMTNIDSFERIVTKKQMQVKTLEETQNKLDAIGNGAGEKFTNKGVANYIEQMPANKNRLHIETLWENFQKTVEECRQKNITNNRIMDASSTHLRQAIGILRGETTEPEASLYGASGKQKHKAQGQSLAIA